MNEPGFKSLYLIDQRKVLACKVYDILRTTPEAIVPLVEANPFFFKTSLPDIEKFLNHADICAPQTNIEMEKYRQAASSIGSSSTSVPQQPINYVCCCNEEFESEAGLLQHDTDKKCFAGKSFTFKCLIKDISAKTAVTWWKQGVVDVCPPFVLLPTI